MDLEDVRERLSKTETEDIRFNEPHFTDRLLVREGSRREVIEHLTRPEKLVHVGESEGKYGDTVYELYFAVSEKRTLLLPTIFDDKGLYILTYIMRYRNWKNMVGGTR